MNERSLVGLDVDFTGDLVSQYTSARSSGYSFITSNLFHPRLTITEDGKPSESENLPSTRSDLAFQKDGQSLVRCVVGKTSTRIDVDSDLYQVRMRSETQLKRELSWAAHLGLPAIMMTLSRPNNVNLARMLSDFIYTEYMPIKLWISLPMAIECDNRSEISQDMSIIRCSGHASGDCEKGLTSQPSPLTNDPWQWWRDFSTFASDISDSLGLVLQLPGNLPDEQIVARWLSEPVVCIVLRTELFLTNAKGYPILPKSHQRVLQSFFKLNVQVLISGSCRNDHGFLSYQKYIAWLWKSRGELGVIDQQSSGLEDQLQEPLQPLRDNLSSTTYAVFETDPYKYAAYEKAIGQALQHRVGLKITAHGMASEQPAVNSLPPTTKMQVVAVLGAGRGPLVNATLCASQTTGVPVRVYVVEKNPNALYTLQDRMTQEWRGLDVHLIKGDMRELKLPEKADIFVSELLGSFGDNELSPECLDGAQPFLKDDGISIPCSYTSFIAPFQSLQFYSESKRTKDPTSTERGIIPQESPYVVRLINCQILSDPLEVFTFHHPKTDLSATNARSATCTFHMEQDSVIHGLAGYFEAKLFGDVTLSIHPKRHSPQMVSWFPMAFPLIVPIHVRAGDRVTVHVWRVVDVRHVWYEWALSEPHPLRIHNVAGHAYKMAL